MAKPDIRKELEEIRVDIDAADNGIVKLLAERRVLVIRLARIKKPMGSSVLALYERARSATTAGERKGLGAANVTHDNLDNLPPPRCAKNLG